MWLVYVKSVLCFVFETYLWTNPLGRCIFRWVCVIFRSGLPTDHGGLKFCWGSSPWDFSSAQFKQICGREENARKSASFWEGKSCTSGGSFEMVSFSVKNKRGPKQHRVVFVTLTTTASQLNAQKRSRHWIRYLVSDQWITNGGRSFTSPYQAIPENKGIQKKKEIHFFSIKNMHCWQVLTFFLSPAEWQTFCQDLSTCYYFPQKKTEFPCFFFISLFLGITSISWDSLTSWMTTRIWILDPEKIVHWTTVFRVLMWGEFKVFPCMKSWRWSTSAEMTFWPGSTVVVHNVL